MDILSKSICFNYMLNLKTIQSLVTNVIESSDSRHCVLGALADKIVLKKGASK